MLNSEKRNVVTYNITTIEAILFSNIKNSKLIKKLMNT